MPTPTSETLAIWSLTSTLFAPMSLAMRLARSTALGRSALGMVKDRSVRSPWLTFWMIMSTRMLAAPIAPKMRAAIPGLSGTPTNVTFAWLRSPVTPETTTCSMSRSSLVTSVPLPSAKVDLTTTGTPYLAANSTERLWSTFAPRLASSSISSYDTLFSRRAAETTFGSAVYTPSTSV